MGYVNLGVKVCSEVVPSALGLTREIKIDSLESADPVDEAISFPYVDK